MSYREKCLSRSAQNLHCRRLCEIIQKVVSDFLAIHSSEEPDAKKAKGDEEEEEEDDYNFADIAEGSVTSVRIRGDDCIEIIESGPISTKIS